MPKMRRAYQTTRQSEVELNDRYTCYICDNTTYNPDDILHGYCPNCHAFTKQCTIGFCKETPEVIFGNVAACAEHAAEINRGLNREKKKIDSQT